MGKRPLTVAVGISMRLKQKIIEPTELDGKTDGAKGTPFELARATVDNLLTRQHRRAQQWRYASFGLLGTTVLTVGALGTLAVQSRFVPYVVVVDQLNRPQAFGPATQMREPEERWIRAELGRFLINIRSVFPDPSAQREMVERAYAYVDQSAAPALNSYFSRPENAPLLLGKELIRRVQVLSLRPVPGSNGTYNVEWIETDTPLSQSRAPRTAVWQGYLATKIVPPASSETIIKNPLGLYVTDVSWTEVAQRDTPAAAVPTAPVQEQLAPPAAPSPVLITPAPN